MPSSSLKHGTELSSEGRKAFIRRRFLDQETSLLALTPISCPTLDRKADLDAVARDFFCRKNILGSASSMTSLECRSQAVPECQREGGLMSRRVTRPKSVLFGGLAGENSVVQKGEHYFCSHWFQAFLVPFDSEPECSIFSHLMARPGDIRARIPGDIRARIPEYHDSGFP